MRRCANQHKWPISGRSPGCSRPRSRAHPVCSSATASPCRGPTRSGWAVLRVAGRPCCRAAAPACPCAASSRAVWRMHSCWTRGLNPRKKDSRTAHAQGCSSALDTQSQAKGCTTGSASPARAAGQQRLGARTPCDPRDLLEGGRRHDGAPASARSRIRSKLG